MNSLFVDSNVQTLQIYFIGITLPFVAPDGTIQETPTRWLKLSNDLYAALKHDQLEVSFLLDKLINVESGNHRQIRLARIVATATSDFEYIQRQTSLQLRKKTDLIGARSQFIFPERLLSAYVYDALTYLYHDYSPRSHRAIYQDAALWQRKMAQHGHPSALRLKSIEELRLAARLHRQLAKQHETR
ncbi:hypothetical protein HAU32_11075 [Weissella confusa]|uniref:Uncharacterized protein n=1 Tax=Weissella fermenti TaxID=2987699 RepID=A0ABT6D4Y2_9LACO|nr:MULTISPECIES: hypothetical protein [Weissella]MBJ7689481.1 hypothetical protein [Weissella confusa]MCW0928004.1 hypothetical protein [Weissella sp. LMG 11983]MDF9300594.1 hypothetical protein [Weissella sp. BK2]